MIVSFDIKFLTRIPPIHLFGPEIACIHIEALNVTSHVIVIPTASEKKVPAFLILWTLLKDAVRAPRISMAQ